MNDERGGESGRAGEWENGGVGEWNQLKLGLPGPLLTQSLRLRDWHPSHNEA